MTVDWDGGINFRSYDQVESLDNYQNKAELEAYRSERLDFCAERSAFVLKVSGLSSPLNVVDVGSGSSALLYAMASEGVLKSGMGIELSESRHRFAEQWKTEKGFLNVVNRHTDFANVTFDKDATDLFLCIDNTLSLIGAEDNGYARHLANSAFGALRSGGCLVIEIHNQAKVLASLVDDERQFWRELPETNAFKFALYRQSFNRALNLIRSESIYVRRDGDERRKADMEAAYTQAALEALLSSAGFVNFKAYGGYDFSAFDIRQSEYLVVLASKP